jgi:hypothetical protein
MLAAPGFRESGEFAPNAARGTMPNLNPELLSPAVALIAGILILIMPRLLNYVVAIYLIIIGILGLSHHFHT